MQMLLLNALAGSMVDCGQITEGRSYANSFVMVRQQSISSLGRGLCNAIWLHKGKNLQKACFETQFMIYGD